jgi:DNA-binding HxlR family transcriptional regulator
MTETRPDAPPSAPSALEATLARVGDRWSLLIVEALLAGPRRFGELEEAIDGIASNVLSQRLRHLEGERIVLALPYQERPVRYAYELTAAGRSLAGALRLLAQWSLDHSEAEAPLHALCGSPLEARWYCPTCELVADDPEGGTPPYV